MAKQIVTKAEGEAYRIEADGSKIKLRVGDLIDDGARIITETGASVRFEDEKGVPLEIGENTGTILFSDAGPELSGTLLAAAPQDAPAKETDAPTPDDAGAQNPLPSDSEGEDDSEAHSFVELPRIKYGSDINLQYARDVNVTDQIEGRASLNPRIKYSYNLSIDQEIQSYKDTRFPFDGGAKPFEPERPTAGDPPAPETDGTKAVTAEDTGITVDPLENFVTPAGVELTVTGAAAQHGTVEILPDGTLKYTPAPDWFGTDVVNCTSTDQSGRTYNSTVEVTVTPVIDTRDDDAGTVRENSAIDTDVTANDLFADHEGAKVVSVTDGKYGTVTINEDGTVKYTPAIDFLAEGETITDQYTYTVQTAAGNLESATVTVTITGTNDAPVVTAITGTATEDTTLTASGNIIADHVTDADISDSHTISAVNGDDAKVGTSVDGTYGSITVNADGTYTYTLNNGTNGDGGNSVQKLAEGEHYDEVFSVTVSDGHGGETTQNITITVHGTNDAPTALNNAGSVVEDTRVSVTDADGVNTDGNILANDDDIDNGHTLTIAEVEGSAANVGKATNGEYGTVTISENGTYKYDLANDDPRVQALAEGETLTDTFRITTTDEHGATVNETLTITITGTNDAPEISVITGSVTEDVTLTSSGNVITEHVTDLDATDTHTIIKVDGAESKVGQEITGTYGTIVINTDGSYTYTLNNDADSVQSLGEGETHDEIFSVTVSDGHGGEATQDITITVNGTNDAPTAKDNAGSVVEDDRTSTTESHTTSDGNILANDDDIDNGHTLTIAEVEGSAANVGKATNGEYGTVTISENGTYKYDLANDDPRVQALAEGETLTDTFRITTTDEHGATVNETLTITITGTNDAPEISVITGSVTEDVTLTSSGNVITEHVTDLDATDTHTIIKVDGAESKVGQEITGTYGTIVINTDGSYTYTLNNDADSVQSLGEGETHDEIFSVTVSDGHGGEATQDITITVNGTNDAPTAKDNAGSVVEDDRTSTTESHTTSDGNILANDNDIDKGAVLNVSQVEGSTANVGHEVTGTYGKVTINADGTYTYELNNGADNVQALRVGQTVTDAFDVVVTDEHGATVTETLTITITGTNDRPTIGVAAGTGDSAAADVIEGNIDPSVDKAEAIGTLTFSDIDLGDTVKVTKLALSDADFTISGPQDGLISTRAELYDMLTLTDTTFTTADGTNSHRLTWTFESGDERFNYLKADETLTLIYKVQAKDDSGITANDTSNTQDIVITIKGSDSAADSKPSPDTGTVAEDKTLTVSGHHGTSGANQNLLYNDDSDGAIASFKVKGDDTQYGVGKDVDVKIGANTIGTINIKANGDYTFTPVKNYSGPVPQITYTTSDGKTSTLDITVTPVADKPTWETPAPSTDGREDTEIEMHLKLPTITDATDLNGTGNAGDHPERLGYITLENIGKATVYNGAAVLTATGGKITIAIVDSANNLDTSLHYTGLDISDANIVTLTQAEFEALTIQQEAESGKNITGLKLSVTSYETDDSGVPLKNGDGSYISATSSANVAVDVLAVTDATPTITLGGFNSTPTASDLTTAIANHHITITDTQGTATGTISAKTEGGSGAIVIEEDCTMKIDADYLKASVSSTDTDGSEKYVVTVSGLAAGSVVNGVTAGADGTVTLTAETSVKSGSIDIFTSGLTITPPENFSGKMGGVTIKVETYDTDSDSSGTIAHNTAEMTLPALVVTPVVDGVDTIAVKQAVGDEDTYIALDIKPSSQDPNETFNVRISDIPKGATIKYGDAEYKCGNDGKLVHVDGTGNPTGIKLEDDKIIINDFDTSKLSILPPKDSNADFVLKVEAQTVERDGIQVSDWADSPTLNLAVTVHSVADPVYVLNTALTPLTYTETQAETNQIKLGKLIVKTADNADGSEQVTLTVTNLAPEFTLAGSAVEFKGGEGTGRTWLVTMDKDGSLENTDAYIKTPANFSGEIKFSAQATNTDSTQAGTGTPDSNTSFSQVTNVAITVTPTPEATVNLSGAANEDELQQLSFAIKHQNGDTDETLNAVYIKASEVDAGHGKNFSVFYSEDGGTTTMTLQEALDAGKITKDGGFYKITSADGNDVDKIFVKGNAEYSGTGNELTVKYAVTDEAYTGEGTHTTSTPVTTVSGDTNYGITFKPVTDQTTMKAVAAGDITVDGSGEITLSGTTVTVGAGSANSFSVDVTVNAPADVDGSEHFIKLIVDGVPDGVSVNGATYLGDSGAAVGTGRWLLTVDAGKFFDSSHGSFTTKLDFTVDRGNPNIWGLHGEGAVKVTVTAVSQDEMGSMKGGEAASSTGAEFGIKIGFDGTDPAHADIPAPGINITKGAGTVEDSGECTLGDFFKAEYQINSAESQEQTEYRFSFEINGLPKDTIVSGDAVKGGSVTITAAGGGVTVSGFGNEAAMQSVLDNVKVTLPQNYNNNSDGVTTDGMNLNVTWKTDGWDLNGGDAPAPATDTIKVTPNVTPITDPMEITIVPASGTMDENQPGDVNAFSFTVRVGAGNDGDYGNVLHEGKLFLKLDGAGKSDTITYGGNTYTLTDVADKAYSGITPGKYYVIENVKAGDVLALAYQPADYYSGNIKVTATIVSKETGATNEIAASGNSELTVNPVNSAYDFTVDDAAANENGTADLTISPSGGHDADGSEKIHSVVLSGVDAEHSDYFIVKYTVDGAVKTAAKVAAGTDADGKQLYEWVLSTDSAGKLPTGITITGLNHYSGTQDLTMTVVTGETALGTGKENSYDFSLTFHPTADGFSDFTPTLTFGKAGEYIDLNLNAMVNDTSGTGSETATVTLKDLGDGASFFIARDTNGDGTADSYVSVTTAYDAANKTYTLSGIALNEINDIKILSPNVANVGKTNVTVDAWTVEPDAQDDHKESAHISAGGHGTTFDITVSAAAPTSGADRLIYGGDAGTYDGGDGTDTLYLANFRETANSAKNDIDFEAAATIKNIEIIDMSDGAHSLIKVTAEAVKNMTDAGNKLLIKGGDDDKIALSGVWVKGADTSDGWRTYTNDGATINVDGGVNVTINGIASMSLMMAMAFAPLAAAAEPAIMPDSLAGCDFSSEFGAAGASGSPAFSLTAEGMIDFSSLTHSSFGTLDMENASAQSLYHVAPYGVYGVTDGSHELTVTGTELDSVSLADSAEAAWGAPELSADGSHYSYTATGDFDHDAATPDDTVTLNVSRAIYDDTLAYDAHAMNDGGLGDDTLTFGHEDSTVDFSGGAASHIANIEKFDLGDGSHTLENLTAKDVFNMTDARGTLTINGDNADHVTLSDVLDDATDGMWESSPFQSVESGVSYSVYTGSFEGHMVTLKIEDEIIQQLTTHTKG